jgi:hypothetical protein
VACGYISLLFNHEPHPQSRRLGRMVGNAKCRKSDVTSQEIIVLALGMVAVAAIYAIFRGAGKPESIVNPREISYDGLGVRIPRGKDSWSEGDGGAWVEWSGPRVEEALGASFNTEERVCIDRSFVTRLVGVKYENDDGTSRVGAIERIYTHERLIVRWEKDYPRGNGFGKSVSRKNGQQLGWLSKEVAKHIHDEFIEPGHTWMAVFQYATRHPNTGEIVGAAILVVRRTPAGGDWFWDREQNSHLCVACTSCGATIGQRCKTNKGVETYTVHTPRIKTFQELMNERNASASTM